MAWKWSQLLKAKANQMRRLSSRRIIFVIWQAILNSHEIPVQLCCSNMCLLCWDQLSHLQPSGLWLVSHKNWKYELKVSEEKWYHVLENCWLMLHTESLGVQWCETHLRDFTEISRWWWTCWCGCLGMFFLKNVVIFSYRNELSEYSV